MEARKEKQEAEPITPEMNSTSYHIDIEQLKFSQLLKEGGSGCVHRGEYHGAPVAIKVLSLSRVSLENCKHEGEIMQMLTASHAPHFVHFIGSAFAQNTYYIVMGLENGSLQDLIDDPDKNKRFIMSICHKFFVQMASTIAYLHSNNFIHNDIKPANFLLNDNNDIKLCDFGLTTTTENGIAGKGSLCWTAPEVYYSDPTTASDVYSLCLTFLSTYKCEGPFSNLNEYTFIDEVIFGNKREPIPNDCPKGLASMITLGFMEKEKRPTAESILNNLNALNDTFTRK